MAGQLIERGKNTWLVRVYLGRDADGKRQSLSKTIHGTKKQAQTWLNKTLTERDAGVAIKPAQQTLGEYLDHWLESAAKPRVRPKTFAGYSDMLNRHIRPALGLRPLSKLTPLEIQRVFHAMAERGLSARSIEYTRMILKQALKQAVSWRLLVFNPCEGVQIPRQERREM
ncbi:MAG: tyrosine-type recombinase/integrase family protein [Bryobacteraceae bacterium]|nr:tyrosine-type recombinase/integrase family protein [Bryobacteraceae bacterium]